MHFKQGQVIQIIVKTLRNYIVKIKNSLLESTDYVVKYMKWLRHMVKHHTIKLKTMFYQKSLCFIKVEKFKLNDYLNTFNFRFIKLMNLEI